VAGGCAAGGHTGFSTGGHTSGSGAATCGAGAGGGALAHAASRNAAARPLPIADNGSARKLEENEVGWVFLEIALALAIAVLIVWWTLPRKPRDRREDDER
jgi:hypothetical protein